jgi:hypothetical protein
MALIMRAGNLAVTAVSVLGRRASAFVGSHARLPSRKLHGRLEIVKAPIHLGQVCCADHVLGFVCSSFAQ